VRVFFLSEENGEWPMKIRSDGKIRPLGELSDFVVEKLPQALEQKSGRWLTKRIHQLVYASQVNHTWHILEATYRNPLDDDLKRWRRIATLDLKMLESALVHSNGIRTWEHVELINAMIQDGEAPVLTYEDVVLLNPPSDMRLFTRGEIGVSERAFYEAHCAIEQKLTIVIASVEALMQSLEGKETGQEILEPVQLKEILKWIVESFESTGLKNMPLRPIRHFDDGFRQYFMSNNRRRMRGPSGAFSGQMPTLEILFRGDSPSKDSQLYVRNCSMYFPRMHWKQLQKTVDDANKGRTLENLIATSSHDTTQAKEYVKLLAWFFYAFRLTHLNTLGRQAPDVLRLNADGTGGVENVNNFLRGRLGPEPENMW
jgi:hypothetical protein